MGGRFLAVTMRARLAATILAVAAYFATAVVADDFPDQTLPDAISGKDLALVDAQGRQATVLVCLSIECPISNEYMPTINKIADAYCKRGVNFIGINPGGGQSLDEMADYARKHSLTFPFVKDAGGKVSRRLLYSVTPEVRLFDAGGKLVYSGRIDDRYRRGGATDKNVAKDLEVALDEVLAGKPVSSSRTKPVGCPIQIADPKSGN
ncbi:MAG: redoxin domain-containing protein [Pirellulales bacterium]